MGRQVFMGIGGDMGTVLVPGKRRVVWAASASAARRGRHEKKTELPGFGRLNTCI